MTSKMMMALAALVLLGAAGLAVQPVLAQQQDGTTLVELRQEIRRLEARVARLERESQPRLQPAG